MREFQTTPVYRRERLRAGHRVPGPAIVEQMDSTTVILHRSGRRVVDELTATLILAGRARASMDRITVEVIGAALLAIAEEMGEALIRPSYSTNIKERRDCSTALFDARADARAQAEHIPMHLGCSSASSRRCCARIRWTQMRAGDVFIGNDAYTGGGTHLPDIRGRAGVPGRRR